MPLLYYCYASENDVLALIQIAVITAKAEAAMSHHCHSMRSPTCNGRHEDPKKSRGSIRICGKYILAIASHFLIPADINL